MKPSDVNEYINWVVFAVTGRMAEADVLMRKSSHGILRTARYMRKSMPQTKEKHLYRGLLLEPELIREKLGSHPQLTFDSWTEDKDVALWFADPHSIIGEFVKMVRPTVAGYIMDREPNQAEMLWHHSWKFVPFGGRRFDLAVCAHMHPLTAPFADQFAWSMKSQSEVIMIPSSIARKLELVIQSEQRTAMLDSQLAPPLPEW